MLPLTLAPKRKSPTGSSWVFPAVAEASRDLARFSEPNCTKLILVFSDGVETTDARPEDAAAVAEELGVVVYPVALGHKRIADSAHEILARGELKPGSGANMEPGKIRAQQQELLDFADLGELTGDRSFDPRQLDALAMRAEA